MTYQRIVCRSQCRTADSSITILKVGSPRIMRVASDRPSCGTATCGSAALFRPHTGPPTADVQVNNRDERTDAPYILAVRRSRSEKGRTEVPTFDFGVLSGVLSGHRDPRTCVESERECKRCLKRWKLRELASESTFSRQYCKGCVALRARRKSLSWACHLSNIQTRC